MPRAVTKGTEIQVGVGVGVGVGLMARGHQAAHRDPGDAHDLPISPHISLHLAISPLYISLYLPRQVTHTKRVVSTPGEDQLFVTMPPGVAGGERFAAILRDGTELVVTAPTGLAAGKQVPHPGLG